MAWLLGHEFGKFDYNHQLLALCRYQFETKEQCNHTVRRNLLDNILLHFQTFMAYI